MSKLVQDFKVRVVMYPGRELEYSENAVRDFVVDFVRGLKTGDTLSHTSLSVAVLTNFVGMVNIHVQVPGEDVIPKPHEVIVPGVIEVFQKKVDSIEAFFTEMKLSDQNKPLDVH